MTFATAQDTALILGAAAAVIVAISGLLSSAAGVFIQIRTQRKVDEQSVKIDDAANDRRSLGLVLTDVHEQVTTINGKTMANIADEGETRRIEDIPDVLRTDAEREHIEAVPLET